MYPGTKKAQIEEVGSIKCLCQKFKSAMICPHSLAVAEDELCLPEFLAKVRKRRKEPDPYQLVHADLPKSSGKKPSTTKRKGKANDKREPLMQILQSSSMATPPSSVAVESIAVSALLALSGTNSLANGVQATNDDENFSLKHLEGHASEDVLRLWSGHSGSSSSTSPTT